MAGDSKQLIPLLAVGAVTGGVGYAVAGAGAAAGTTATGGLFTAQNLALAATGLQAVGSVYSGVKSAEAARIAQRNERLAAQQDRTQTAVEDAQRARRLRELQAASLSEMAATGRSPAALTSTVLLGQQLSDYGYEAQLSAAALGSRQAVSALNIREQRRAAGAAMFSGLTQAASVGVGAYATYKNRGGNG